MGILKGCVLDSWNRSPISPGLSIKANILIDQTGRACLADFGLLTIISDPQNLSSSSSCMQGGTIRWMSPELINPEQFGFENSRPTKHSDCYALGMVIYEIISGQLPFRHDAHYTILRKVLNGEHPRRGARFTSSLWKMLEQCWASRPNDRPNIEEVLECLETLLNFPESPLGLNEEMEGCDERDSADGSSGVGYDRDTDSRFPSCSSSRSASKATMNAAAMITTTITIDVYKKVAFISPSTTPTAERPLQSPTPFADTASIQQTIRSSTQYYQSNSSRITSATSWSEHTEVDLVANLSSRERTRQEVLFEIVSSEERSGYSPHPSILNLADDL